MFPEPTELLLIGCLIESIRTPRFKSVTLTPNTYPQTFWQKGMSHVMSGPIHLFNVSHFSSTCCTKNFSLISCSTMTKRIQDQKAEERVVSKSRPAAMNLSSFIATSYRIESDCISKSGDADSFGETREQDEYWSKLIPHIVDFSSATEGCILWRVNGKAAGRPVASRRRRFRRLRQSWGWDLVRQSETSYGETCCPKQ